MSSVYNQYLIVGIKISHPEDADSFYEKYESFTDNGYQDDLKYGISMIFDNDFIVIGKILFKSSLNEPFDENIIEILNISDDLKIYLLEEIKHKFNISNKPIKLYIVTHWH